MKKNKKHKLELELGKDAWIMSASVSKRGLLRIITQDWVIIFLFFSSFLAAVFGFQTISDTAESEAVVPNTGIEQKTASNNQLDQALRQKIQDEINASKQTDVNSEQEVATEIQTEPQPQTTSTPATDYIPEVATEPVNYTLVLQPFSHTESVSMPYDKNFNVDVPVGWTQEYSVLGYYFAKAYASQSFGSMLAGAKYIDSVIDDQFAGSIRSYLEYKRGQALNSFDDSQYTNSSIETNGSTGILRTTANITIGGIPGKYQALNYYDHVSKIDYIAFYVTTDEVYAVNKSVISESLETMFTKNQ